jgi:hypothetical protein
MLQNNRKKQQYLKQIQLKHNTEMKRYVYKYKLFIEGKKEPKRIKKPKTIKKVTKKAPKKVAKK